jgi:hypothetical protein
MAVETIASFAKPLTFVTMPLSGVVVGITAEKMQPLRSRSCGGQSDRFQALAKWQRPTSSTGTEPWETGERWFC